MIQNLSDSVRAEGYESVFDYVMSNGEKKFRQLFGELRDRHDWPRGLAFSLRFFECEFYESARDVRQLRVAHFHLFAQSALATLPKRSSKGMNRSQLVAAVALGVCHPALPLEQDFPIGRSWNDATTILIEHLLDCLSSTYPLTRQVTREAVRDCLVHINTIYKEAAET